MRLSSKTRRARQDSGAILAVVQAGGGFGAAMSVPV
jgi:hypothetical protein